MAALPRPSLLRPLASLLLLTSLASLASATICQTNLDPKTLQLEVFNKADPAVVIFHGPEK